MGYYEDNLPPTTEFDDMDPELNRFVEDFNIQLYIAHQGYHIRMLETKTNTFRLYAEPYKRVKVVDFKKKETHVVPVDNLYELLKTIVL